LSTVALAASERFYRCKIKDAELYKLLQDMVGRFVTLEQLKEVAHMMDTQVNESFNNTVALLAPKNKVYCGSSSLLNRVGIAVGIKSIGMLQYFTRLYKALGINMTPNVAHYIAVKDGSRFKRLTKIKTKAVKTIRLQTRIIKLKEDEVIAKKERSKPDGTYETGQHMKDVCEEAGQPAKKKSRRDLKCRTCGQMGHATNRSKDCLDHLP
jgi:hypothetical protein